MQRTKRSTAVAVLPAAPAGGVAGYFAQPNPSGGVPATVPGYEWYNNVQEELVALVLAAGLTLSDTDRTQLLQALIQKGMQGCYFNISVAGGTADAITGAFNPPITALTDGMELSVLCTSSNATTAPTFKADGTPIKGIVKGDGIPLAPGDILRRWNKFKYDAGLDKWVQQGPASGIYGSGYLLIRDEKPSGTNGGSSAVGVQTRDLNTVDSNTIPGASLAANQITLPAGTYRIRAQAPSLVNSSKAYFYNVTTTLNQLVGTSVNGISGVATDQAQSSSEVLGRFSIAAPCVFQLRQYCSESAASVGLGAPSSTGSIEVYSSVEIIKES